MKLKVKKNPSYYFGKGIGYNEVKDVTEVSFKGNMFSQDHLIKGETYYFPYEKVKEKNISLEGNDSTIIIDANLFHKNVGQIDNFDGEVEIIYKEEYPDFYFSEVVNSKILSLTDLNIYSKSLFINFENKNEYLCINRGRFACDYIGLNKNKRIVLNIDNSDNIKFVGCNFSHVDIQITGDSSTDNETKVCFIECIFNDTRFSLNEIDDLSFTKCTLKNKNSETRFSAKNIDFNHTVFFFINDKFTIDNNKRCSFNCSKFLIEKASSDIYTHFLVKNNSNFNFYPLDEFQKFNVFAENGISIDGEIINDPSKAKELLLPSYHLLKHITVEYGISLSKCINQHKETIDSFLNMVKKYDSKPVLDLKKDIINFSVLQNIINNDLNSIRGGVIFDKLNSALVSHFERNKKSINPIRKFISVTSPFEKEFFDTPYFDYKMGFENRELRLTIGKVWGYNQSSFNNIILTVKKAGNFYNTSCNVINDIGNLDQDIIKGFDNAFELYNYYRDKYGINLTVKKNDSRNKFSDYNVFSNNGYPYDQRTIKLKDDFDAFQCKATLHRDFKFDLEIDKNNFAVELDDSKKLVENTILSNESYLDMLKVRITDLPLPLRNIVVAKTGNDDSLGNKIDDDVLDFNKEIVDGQVSFSETYIKENTAGDNLYSIINDANEKIVSNPSLLNELFGLEMNDGKVDFTLMREIYKKQIEAADLDLSVTNEVITLLGGDPFFKVDALLNKTQAVLKLEKINDSTGFIVDEINHGAYNVSIYINEQGKFASNIKINDSINDLEKTRLVKMKDDFPNVVLASIPSNNDGENNFLLVKKK